MQRSYDRLSGESPSKNTLFFETNYIDQAYAFVDMIKEYGWQNLGLIYDEELSHMNFAYSFKRLYDSESMQIKDEIIIDVNDPSSATTLTARLQGTTQSSGARVILVCTNPVFASQLLRAADISVMGGSGYAWIFCSDSMHDLGEISKNTHVYLDSDTFGVLKSGAVGFAAEDDESLTIDPLIRIKSALVLAGQYLQTINIKYIEISGSKIVNYIMSNPSTPSLDHQVIFDSKGFKISNYNILNIQEFEEKYVGYYDAKNRAIKVNSNSIIWPGFTKFIPNDKIPLMTICLLYPAHDESGNEFSEGLAIKRGFDLGVKEVNEKKLIGDYQLIVEYRDTFMTPELASSIIKSLASFNVISYVGPFTTQESLAYSTAIESTADPKPFISYGASWANLTSSDNYPSFVRMIQSNDLDGVALALFVQQEG